MPVHWGNQQGQDIKRSFIILALVIIKASYRLLPLSKQPVMTDIASFYPLRSLVAERGEVERVGNQQKGVYGIVC